MHIGRLILVSVAFVGVAHAQQVCNEQIDFNTPSGRFQNGGDGTVYDFLTGLMWQRCPIGYDYSDGGTPESLTDDNCTASTEVEFNWQGALFAAVDHNAAGGFAGFTDWRLPNTKELNSIFETRCSWPAINIALFPDTPNLSFWTNTPWRDTSAMTIDFSQGGLRSSGKLVMNHLRVVRNANPPPPP